MRPTLTGRDWYRPARRLALLTTLAASCGSPALAAPQPLLCLIQPSRIAEVGTPVTGVIGTLPIERGQFIAKGGVIAVLRNSVERAALDVAQSRAQADADVQSARAGRDYARQRLARHEELLKKAFISEQALEQIRTEARVAEQTLAQAQEQQRTWQREMSLAQRQLAQRTITSPFAGVVAEKYLSVGERVEDRSIARIVGIDPLHVEVMVPASQFGTIAVGSVASVVPDLPNASPKLASVALVDKLIDGASNTFRVRLLLDNPDLAIPAGVRCKTYLNVGAAPTARATPPAKPKATPPAASRVAPPRPPTARRDALPQLKLAESLSIPAR